MLRTDWRGRDVIVFLNSVLILANVLVLPYFLFLLAVAAAAMTARRPAASEAESRSRFLVVIPAHDEESGIATTVASCRSADYPESLFNVLVIADNCTDRTAAVAVEAGARVVERSDPVKKSKGYAIEYLIARLVESGEFDTLDALVVIDADTTIDPSLLRRFDAHLRVGDDWVQSYYTVANPDESWRTRLMTYAFSLFNGVMPLGQTALGTSAGLRGNGMCFSTRGLRRRPWTSYGLVEDMEFSWTLRLSGERIAFEPASRVFGAMVGSGGKAAAGQRRRWEFGRTEVRRTYTGRVLRSDRIGWWEKLISLCELTIPPMGPLLAIYAVLAVLDLLAFVATPAEAAAVRWVPLACGAVMTVSVGLYAVSPFFAMRLPWRFARSLVQVPAYVGWKVFVRLGGRPKAWVRTARDTRSDAERPVAPGGPPG
jgi:cellulose synthase/poly-beta-1,6-N-acetylglucosamine synthase-like glycosyltransferase